MPADTIIPRGPREEIRVEWKPSGGVALRVWFRAADGTMRPGKEHLKLSRPEAVALAAAVVR